MFFRKLREKKQIKKGEELAKQLLMEAQVRKASGRDVSDEGLTVTINPTENTARSIWRIVLSLTGTFAYIALGALALIGLISLITPESRQVLLELWENTIENIRVLINA